MAPCLVFLYLPALEPVSATILSEHPPKHKTCQSNIASLSKNENWTDQSWTMEDDIEGFRIITGT